VNRSTMCAFVFATASAAVALVPLASASAQSLSTPVLTPEQVRGRYLAEGFQASQPTTWWTNGSTSFTVEDPAEQSSPSARVLMVIVYPDAASAEAERADGGHVVPGYGPSILQRNVALMQSTRSELARRFADELNRDDPSYLGTAREAQTVVGEPSYRVALDFIAVIQDGLGNL
jgi:hypothetical protein